MDFFFEGHWRLDWLGNPNKTAVLIACLMVASWSLAFVRKWGFWTALVLNFILGVCLVQTYSRGGILAAGAGLALLAFFSRPWPRKRVVALSMTVGLLLALSLWTGAASRCSQGMLREDRSITNRLEIWQAAARMILDAPSGWEIGQSGQAYMQWYQPLGRDEPYRTLVNSHLTWLVEFSWMGRIAYLAGWGTVILLCWPSQRHRWFCVPLGIWTAFGVGAFFSSVAESPWLWVIPGMAFLAVLVTRFFFCDWPRARSWGWIVGWIAAVVVSILILGRENGPVQIRKGSDFVMITPATDSEFSKGFTLIAPDPKILGERYGHAVRALVLQKGWHVSVLDGAGQKWVDSDEGVLMGDGVRELPGRSTTVKFLNPRGKPPVAPAVRPRSVTIYWGELFQSSFRSEWETWARERGFTFQTVFGAGEYLSQWPDLVAPP